MIKKKINEITRGETFGEFPGGIYEGIPQRILIKNPGDMFKEIHEGNPTVIPGGNLVGMPEGIPERLL